MPASRRARAMILAPRSCPSSPGLATTTRIFLSVAEGIEGAGILLMWVQSAPPHPERHRAGCPRRALEDRGLAITADHGLELADHFPLGAFGARGLDQQRHQVLARVARRLDKRLQRPRRAVAVASLANRLDPVHLVDLEGGIDAEDLGPEVVTLGVGVDADHLAHASLKL